MKRRLVLFATICLFFATYHYCTGLQSVAIPGSVAIIFHTGNDNEAIGNLVEDTRWERIGVSASQRIKIYNNTFNRSYVHANEKAFDACASKTGEQKNILNGNAHII